MSSVVVDQVAWEMAQFEVHALRNELQAVLLRVQVLVREMDQSQQLLDETLLAALRSPAKRQMRP